VERAQPQPGGPEVEPVHEGRAVPGVPFGDGKGRHREHRMGSQLTQALLVRRIAGQDPSRPPRPCFGGQHDRDPLPAQRDDGLAQHAEQSVLVAIGPDQQRDSRGGRCRGGLAGGGQQVPVEPRAEGQSVRAQRIHATHRGEHRSRGGTVQPIPTFGADAQGDEELPSRGSGFFPVGIHIQSTALRDSPGEQAGRVGADQQRRDQAGPGGLTRDGDPRRVPAERRDRLPHPSQSSDHIAQPRVAGVTVPVRPLPERVGQVEEAERPEPVVDRYDDDPAQTCQWRPVVVGGAADPVGAPVNPEEHRQPGSTGRADHVDRQRVLAKSGAGS